MLSYIDSQTSADNSLIVHSTMHDTAEQTVCDNPPPRSFPVPSPVRAILNPQATPITDIEALTTQVTILARTLVAVSSQIDGITEHLRQ